MNVAAEPLVPVWVPEDDPAWTAHDGPRDYRRCRWMMPGRRACGKPSVATLKRGTTQRWWYCEDHLYGRKWRDGLLWHTRWVPLSHVHGLIRDALYELGRRP